MFTADVSHPRDLIVKAPDRSAFVASLEAAAEGRPDRVTVLFARALLQARSLGRNMAAPLFLSGSSLHRHRSSSECRIFALGPQTEKRSVQIRVTVSSSR